ncbi:flavin oxidoreductase [Patiriisocius marinistellae]|uniref:Flavin oxidoreductase n=1 Tax=Patiriisocius marinistellae TaxID=2494560 RepID=A0A5J4G0A7_9FLAO|nr:flavin reductase [Patiriisocius marinistellae]GEQ87118.1 flavin oxidoreductase [Patiriisocius marinistellae]
MKHFDLNSISKLEKLYRINLINSCTGYKSANLIATQSNDGIMNIGIFSSIIHLGSNPPLLGFILRPTTVPRNTFDNLLTTGVFTINHVNKNIIEDAHHTSAKYDGEISEFDKTQFEPEFKNNFKAPFVRGVKISMGCHYVNHYNIEENGCLFIIGSIEHLFIDEGILKEDGFLNLENAETVTVNGLDGYALPTLLKRFEYARPKK